MRKKRGFTTVELLSVIAITVIVAAITYPVISSVRMSARRTKCTSNLKQIGVGIALYRENQGAADQGTPNDMGLPHQPGALIGTAGEEVFRCLGNNPRSSSYHFNWPIYGDPPTSQQLWARYIAFVGPTAVLGFDPNHQSSYPRSLQWENWTVIGLRIDNSVFVRTRLGFPLTHRWWHD